MFIQNFFNMSLKFEPYENIMKENIGKLNNNNFAILYAYV